MTRGEALAKMETRWWVGVTAGEIVAFQLYEDRLCMPFDVFHEAIEKALGRSVWTHEFARPVDLRAEFEGKKPPRTPADSLKMLTDMVGEDRVIVVEAPAEGRET